VGKQGVNAGVRFHGRLRVQGVFHFVALLRNRQEVRIGDHIEWIARLLRIGAVADGSIVVTISYSEEHKQRVEGSYQVNAHVFCNTVTPLAEACATGRGEKKQEPRDELSRGS